MVERQIGIAEIEKEEFAALRADEVACFLFCLFKNGRGSRFALCDIAQHLRDEDEFTRAINRARVGALSACKTGR